MILVFSRERFEGWLEFFGPVNFLGNEAGFRAVYHINASGAVLGCFSTIATCSELAHKYPVLSLSLAGSELGAKASLL